MAATWRRSQAATCCATALCGIGYPQHRVRGVAPDICATGRNTYALDPYRMPSKSAFRRGALAAERVLDQHRAANDGAYPETVAVTMWGLDAIKTKGESVAMALALVGAKVVAEGTGRVARFELFRWRSWGGRASMC